MGNFSRNPKDRLDDSVAKHYVGVRLQQAVPVVDADWNELEDLRRRELEVFGTWFIGNGVPSGSDGFHIVSVPQPNDFGIVQGVLLLNGKFVENALTVRYTTQPNFGNPKLDEPLPPLSTPAAPKQFIVYLDVWEREVDSEEDPILIDSRIGMETALRLKREWAVRVARVPEDLPKLQAPPPGHFFYQLARLKRDNGAPITAPMIEDLRDTQVSVLRRIEVRDSNGFIVVDNARFQLMLENTRNNVLKFIKYLLTKFNLISAPMKAAELLGIQTAEHIASTAEIGLSLLSSASLANRGALGILSQLYTAQNNFMEAWRDAVLLLGTTPKTYGSFNTFINKLDDRLNDPNVGALIGLKAGLTAGNLEAATAMQEEIARLFGTVSTDVARGTIQVFLAQSPLGNLNSPPPARFVFKVKSFTTLADTYTVKIIPEQGWPRRVVDVNGAPIPGNKVSIGALGSEATILIDTDVQPGSSSGLQLRVTSDSNPDEIDQLSTQFTLTQGQPAPVGEDKIQIQLQFNQATAGSALFDPGTGIISIKLGVAGNVQMRLFNNTGATATFTVTLEQLNKLGTWNVLFDSSVPPLNNGQSFPLTAIVTPTADATSMNLKITAKTTINAIEMTTQTVIPLQSRP